MRTSARWGRSPTWPRRGAVRPRQALYRKGETAKSFDALRQAVEDNGSNLEGYFRLAQAATDLGRGDDAGKVKREFWRVAATLPRFAGRHRLRWRLAFLFFPLTRYFV
jgi:hypothetical protein